jgi:hypothetical protein
MSKTTQLPAAPAVPAAKAPDAPAPAAKAPDAQPAEATVKGNYRATKSRMHDPYQNITFTSDEAKPAELTAWVKSQLDAGYLVAE